MGAWADVGIFPASFKDKTVFSMFSSYTIFVLPMTPVKTYGEKSLSLDIGLRRTYRWIFVLANVSYPILGAAF